MSKPPYMTSMDVALRSGRPLLDLQGNWPSPGEVITGHSIDWRSVHARELVSQTNTTRSHCLYGHTGLINVKVRMLTLGLNPAPVYSQVSISLCNRFQYRLVYRDLCFIQ